MWLSSTTRMVSASGGSLSKSESLVKDDSRLAAEKQQVSKTKPRSSGGVRSRSWGRCTASGWRSTVQRCHPFLPPALRVYSDVGKKAEDIPKIKLVLHCIVNVC